MSKPNLTALARTINSFKNDNSDRYGRVVPDLHINERGTVDNFDAFASVMLNSGYVKLQNEFVSALMNKIGLTITMASIAANPLSAFKKGALPKGSDAEFIFTNPAVAEDKGVTNDANQQKLLKTYKPDTKVTYLRTNRGANGLGDRYAVTVDNAGLKRAFQSLEDLSEYVLSLVNSLTTGNENDEFSYIKKIVAEAVADNYVVIQPIASDLESADSLKSLVSKFRATFLKMTIPSTRYNAYTNYTNSDGNPVKTSSSKDQICLIITADLAANIDVGVLAAAFNLEKTDLNGRVFVIDEFPGNEGIAAVMCDMSWLQILQSEYALEDFRNAATGSTNFFLRVNGIFSVLPFANAVAFVVDDVDFLPSITGTAITPDSLAVNVGETHNFRFTPANATEDVQVKSDSTATATVDNQTKTYKATGAGNLKLQLVSNGAVVTSTIVVSA
jgi:hypothetical protein